MSELFQVIRQRLPKLKKFLNNCNGQKQTLSQEICTKKAYEQIRAIEKQCKVQRKTTNKQINKPKY